MKKGIDKMDDFWDKKIQIELTIGELEDLIVRLRVANSVVSGDVRSELEEKLSNISSIAKNSI